MSKYRIAWLPGDGIGVEVMDATRVVLDALELDAEYVHGDIGWEFWCREGDAFPQRTIELLKNVDAAMFGAITSKPVKAAEAELVPELKGKGLVYRSPIVRMRQLFDLYVCLRPCKGYPGNPLNYKEGIDLVVFRENTEDLYAGVEFNPVPWELAEVARPSSRSRSRPSRGSRATTTRSPARSTRRRAPSGSSAPRSSSRRKHGRKKVTIVHKANVVRATDGLFLEEAKKVAKEFPEIQTDDANIDAIGDVAAQEPVQLRRARRAEPLRRHHLGPLRADGRRPRLRLLGQHRRASSRCSSRRTARPRSTRASRRRTRSPRSSPRR